LFILSFEPLRELEPLRAVFVHDTNLLLIEPVLRKNHPFSGRIPFFLRFFCNPQHPVRFTIRRVHHYYKLDPNFLKTMKKIISLAFSTALFAALVMGFNGCAPTAAPEQDTTVIQSAPSSLSLTRTDSLQSSSISLSCGCKFGPFYVSSGPLKVIGYGDTSVIHFFFADSIDSLAYNHTLVATIVPSALTSSGSSTSWIALYFDDLGQYPLYDTVRVTATY
jgi:hypothetical protein